MRCAKVRDYYLRNRDGLLNEAEKMKLEEHMDRCAYCTSFAREMDRCLDLLVDLPDVSPSENFEWNLKRAILHEKTRIMRSQSNVSFGDWRWGMKFVTSAAAAALIIITGTWYVSQKVGEAPVLGGSRSVTSVPPSSVNLTPRDYGIINFTSSAYKPTRRSTPYNLVDQTVGAQSVNYTGSYRMRDSQSAPFAANSREDSLMKENEFLWKRVENLEREIMVLQRLLSQERVRRAGRN
jgi:hypothetical protein